MNILFLCHRLPYPPDKGEKIRAYHMLAHLAKRHTVHLGAFVDEPADMCHAKALRQLIGGECLLVPLGASARLKMAAGFARGAPLSVSYFSSARLARWVGEILRKHDIGRAVVFSTAMTPYLLAQQEFDNGRVIFDMVDVDSDKWRQYADVSAGLRAWIYRREMRTLFALERQAAAAFGATLLVSPYEMETFARLAPETRPCLHSVPNGVDLDFFNPDVSHPNPFGADEIPIVMTGTMDYRPNAEGAVWFAQKVLPAIRAEQSNARFYVVGARPSAAVRSLAGSDVVITGKVDDVRPYLAHARAVVAPLKLARGLQNKVLEAMAMARPVVATSPAARALDVSSGRQLWTADEPGHFAQAVLGVLGGPSTVAANGRHYVEQSHDWTGNLAALDRLVDGKPGGQTRRSWLAGSVLPLAEAAE